MVPFLCAKQCCKVPLPWYLLRVFNCHLHFIDLLVAEFKLLWLCLYSLQLVIDTLYLSTFKSFKLQNVLLCLLRFFLPPWCLLFPPLNCLWTKLTFMLTPLQLVAINILMELELEERRRLNWEGKDVFAGDDDRVISFFIFPDIGSISVSVLLNVQLLFFAWEMLAVPISLIHFVSGIHDFLRNKYKLKS